MKVEPLRTSEFWLALVGAIAGVLVQRGVAPQGTEDFVLGILAVILQRVIHKTANGMVPFVNSSTNK